MKALWTLESEALTKEQHNLCRECFDETCNAFAEDKEAQQEVRRTGFISSYHSVVGNDCEFLSEVFMTNDTILRIEVYLLRDTWDEDTLMCYDYNEGFYNE